MTLRQLVLLPITLSAIAALLACGSSSAAPGSITVVLDAVNTPATVNSIVPVTATVLSDPASAGVTWSCTPTPGCGSFTSQTSASGANNNYIAPPIVPSGTVVISAASVTSPTTIASSQAITITTAALQSGTYVFNLSGFDNGSASAGFVSPYFVVGQFTYDSTTGVGITGGEQDFFDYNVGPEMDAITGGTVTTTTDGNIQITLTTADTGLGVGGTETLNAALIPFPASTTIALINEYDASASGSGELAVQDATAATTQPSGGYAFTIGGYDAFTAGGNVFAMGGVINVSTSGDIDGAGSVFDANDSDNAAAGLPGGLYLAQTFADSSVSVPDASGRVTFTLNPTDSADFPQIILAGYIVDGNRIRLIEAADTYAGANQGIAYSQGATVGTFATANLSGDTFVAGMNGADGVGVLQTAIQLTANSDGSVGGFIDFNDLSTVEPASPDPVGAPPASSTVDLTGRVTMPNVSDGGTVNLNFQGYLDGNNHLLLLSMTSGSILNGIGYQQPSGAVGTFDASNIINGYAVGVTGFDSTNGEEFDAVGAVAADGIGTTTGFADINWLAAGPNFVNEPVTSTFAGSTNGIFTGTFNGLDLSDCTFANAANPGCSDDVFNYYLIDLAGDAIVIETDPSQLTAGRLEGQQ